MSDVVFDLIKNLSQTERRYFRLQSSFAFAGDDKRYIRLFDIISKQNEYDEEEVKRVFKDKFFAQKKRQLLIKILESLRAYYQGNSISSQIDSALADYRILLGKSLYKQARKSLRRAEILAAGHEHFADMIRVRQAETELFAAEGDPNQLRTHINNLRKILPKLISLIDNKLAFEREFILFTKWNRETELVRTPKEKRSLKLSIDSPLLRKESNALSVSSRLQFYYIRGLYHFLCGDFEKSLFFFEKQVNCFQVNSSIANEQVHDYTKALANVTLLYSKTRGQEGFNEYYNQLVNFNTKSDHVNEHLQYWKYLLKLNWLVSSCDFENAQNWINKNQKAVEEVEQRLGDNNIMITERNYVMFDTVMVQLCLNEPKKANRVLTNYLNNSSALIKTDAFSTARILSLFVQLELDQMELVSYNLRSVQRFLKERKRIFEFEKLSLSFIQQALKVTDAKSRKQLWIKYYNSLKPLLGNTLERNAFSNFNMLAWLSEKLDK